MFLSIGAHWSLFRQEEMPYKVAFIDDGERWVESLQRAIRPKLFLIPWIRFELDSALLLLESMESF